MIMKAYRVQLDLTVNDLNDRMTAKSRDFRSSLVSILLFTKSKKDSRTNLTWCVAYTQQWCGGCWDSHMHAPWTRCNRFYSQVVCCHALQTSLTLCLCVVYRSRPRRTKFSTDHQNHLCVCVWSSLVDRDSRPPTTPGEWLMAGAGAKMAELCEDDRTRRPVIE